MKGFWGLHLLIGKGQPGSIAIGHVASIIPIIGQGDDELDVMPISLSNHFVKGFQHASIVRGRCGSGASSQLLLAAHLNREAEHAHHIEPIIHCINHINIKDRRDSCYLASAC